MHKVINRYILKEIMSPFMTILLALTFVLLLGRILQIMDLFINKGVSVVSILKIISCLLPSFFLFTIPIALLISILIAMGRLSSDNEIIALKSSGISLMQMYYPIITASLITFMLSLTVSYFILPHSNFTAKRLLFNIVQQNANIGIKEKIFNDDFKGFLIYAEKIPDNKNYMEGILISDKRLINEQNTILAQRAYLVSDSDSMVVKIRLENGSIHTVSSNLKNYRKIDFKSYEIKLDLSTALAHFDESAKSGKDMTTNELQAKINQSTKNEKETRELLVEWHNRFSIPFACIVFGLLALPLGIQRHRSAKAKGFAVGLLIVVLYYLLRIGGEALAITGLFPAFVCVWAPNILFALVGACLLYVIHKEVSFPSKTSIRLTKTANMKH
jgi:lipopolysaccharide export system permease protein